MPGTCSTTAATVALPHQQVGRALKRLFETCAAGRNFGCGFLARMAIAVVEIVAVKASKNITDP